MTETESNYTASVRSSTYSIRSSASSTLVAPSSAFPKARKVSSGRGGSGNLVKPSKLKSEFEDDVETAQKRIVEGLMAVKAHINYIGRAGTGNIHAAAKQRDTPYNLMLDPDDTYEESVKQKAKEARTTAKRATGRGGTGNFVRKTDKRARIKSSKGKKSWRPLAISTSSSLSPASGPSDSGYISPPSTSALSPVSPLSSSTSDGGLKSPRKSQLTLVDDHTSLKNLLRKASFPYALSRGAASNSTTSFVSPVPPEYIQEACEEEDSSTSPKSPRWWRLSRRPDHRDEEREVSPAGPETVLDVRRQFRCAETQSILSEELAEDIDSEIVHVGSDWEEDDLDTIEEVDDADGERDVELDAIRKAMAEKVQLYSS